VRHHLFHSDNADLVVYFGYQPKVIALDIEDNLLFHLVRARPRLPHIRKVPPIGVLSHFLPRRQRFV
jgi:hypothetical protein